MISERTLYRHANLHAHRQLLQTVFLSHSPRKASTNGWRRLLKRGTRRLVRWFHRGIPWNGEWMCIGPIGLGPSTYGNPVWCHRPSGKIVAGYPRYPSCVLTEGSA